MQKYHFFKNSQNIFLKHTSFLRKDVIEGFMRHQAKRFLCNFAVSLIKQSNKIETILQHIMNIRLTYLFSPVFLLCLLGLVGCRSPRYTTIQQVRQADLSQSIICHDTVFAEPEIWIDSTNTYAHEDSLCLQKYGHIEPLGYRGPNFQRFYIHYNNVKHLGNGDYLVNGYTRCRDTIRYFSGHIVLDSVTTYKDWKFSELAEEEGTIFAHYVFNEDTNCAGAGILSGRVSFGYARRHGRYYYDAFWAVADGYCNNQYEGTWTSYDLKQKEKCNWGDFRIPDSEAFDPGVAEFYPYEKYVDFGWKLYDELLYADWGTPQYDSLRKLNEVDETWWMHIQDYTTPYATRLRALLRTPKEEITAAVLCDIIPSSDLEMSIYYNIVEIEEDTTKPFDPTEIIRKYAAADSTNVLEAYMRMGEYVDGELAEAVFDDYIYLYHRLPQRFAQLRKLRSKRWNGAFDEWRKYYDE